MLTDRFLSCDWGTSSFRLRLIDGNDLQVLAEATGQEGVGIVYRNWEQQKNGGLTREEFYTAILKQKVKALSRWAGGNLRDVPIVLSGMASSTLGMVDMPYKKLPFNLMGDDLEVKLIQNRDFNPILIISGACTADDVMRGEETKVVGCQQFLDKSVDEHLLILPGTHPKHIQIQSNIVTGFSTYMTGELFDLFTNHSVLAASVKKEGDLLTHLEAFKNGVEQGLDGNLLHSAFMVRTNQVLKAMPAGDNYYYLSGLLIGAELKSVKHSARIYIVGGKTHQQLYGTACNLAGIAVHELVDADYSLVLGQRAILAKYLQL